jgi:hypothetical protein
MATRLRPAPHLSTDELPPAIGTARIVERARLHAVWLLSQGQSSVEVSPRWAIDTTVSTASWRSTTLGGRRCSRICAIATPGTSRSAQLRATNHP